MHLNALNILLSPSRSPKNWIIGTNTQVQALSIYATALVITFVKAWVSNRLHHRFGFVMLVAAIDAIKDWTTLETIILSFVLRYDDICIEDEPPSKADVS